MSDPRWTQKPRKQILTHRQTGEQIDPAQSLVTQVETNRRRDFAETVASKPVASLPAVGRQPDPPPPPPGTPDLGPDRLHKWASKYIFVSNDHNSGEDPIPNPAFRSASAQFSSIIDAYNFAVEQRNKLDLVNKPDERIVILVIGGYYQEDVTLGVSNIDLYGMGMPIIEGRVMILPDGRIPVTFDGFRVKFASDSDRSPKVAVTIGLQMFDPPGAKYSVILRNLIVESSGYALQSHSRFYANNCEFITTDATGASYAVDYRWNGRHAGFSLISESTLMSPYPLQFTRTGGALRIAAISTTTPGGYATNLMTYGTGMLLLKTLVAGSAHNECWNLHHQHCMIYGTYPKLETLSQTYLLSIACTSPDVDIETNTWFDECTINSRVICEYADSLVPTGTALNNVYVRQSGNNTFDDTIGAPDAVEPSAFLNLGSAMVYAVKSYTVAANWHSAGGSSITDSDTAVPLPDALTVATPW